MALDPILMLQTLRRRAVEEARSALGACLQAESDAADKVRAIDAATQADRAAHARIEDAQQFQDMFLRSVQARQAQRRMAEAHHLVMEANSGVARAAVVAARTEAESVETLIAERTEAARVAATRADQHVLDDMARTRFDFARL